MRTALAAHYNQAGERIGMRNWVRWGVCGAETALSSPRYPTVLALPPDSYGTVYTGLCGHLIGQAMSFDEQKVDDTVLALLHLTSFSEGGVTRSWKAHDWEVMNRLHARGLISDPRTKYKSVVLTDEGARRSKELFKELFEKPHN